MTWIEPAQSGSYFINGTSIEIRQIGSGDTWVSTSHQLNESGGQAQVIVGVGGSLYHPVGAYEVRVRLSYNNSSSGSGWSDYSYTSVFIN